MIILISAVLLILLLILLYANTMNKRPDTVSSSTQPSYLDDAGSAIDGAVETKSREELLEELKKQQLIVTDKLSSNISFPFGKEGTVGEWIVENPPENQVVQQAEVYLDGMLIAKSVPIYPNQHIKAIELKKDIPTGEYGVIAYIHYYNIDTKEYISKAGYKIHLSVR